MADKVVHGVFFVAMLALVVRYANGVSSFVTNGGNVYASTVKGLQGR